MNREQRAFDNWLTTQPEGDECPAIEGNECDIDGCPTCASLLALEDDADQERGD